MVNSTRKDQELRRKNHFRLAAFVILMQFGFLVSAFSQAVSVTGTVTDAQTGEVLPGVNVVLKGTTQGAITSIDGIYQLDVPATNSTLQFSYIGYQLQEIPVENRTEINVVLEGNYFNG